MKKNKILPLFFCLLFFSGQALAKNQDQSTSTSLELKSIATLINQGIGSSPMADKLSQLIQKNPKNLEAHFLLVELYEISGYQDFAEQELDRYENLAPGSFLEAFRKSVYFDDESFARKHLLYARHRYPKEPAVLIVNARGLVRHQKFKEAREILAPISSRGSDIPGLYTLFADISIQEQHYELALAYAQKELAKYPQNLRAKELRILALNGLNKNLAEEQNTIKELYLAHNKSPDLAILFATSLVNSHHFSQALEPSLFGIWCFSSPTMSDLNFQNLQKILRFSKDLKLESQINTFILTNKIEPVTTAMIYLKIGQAYKAIGQNQYALKYFNKSLARTSFFSNKIYSEIAPLLEKSGDYATAAYCYRKAYEANPRNRSIRREYEAFNWGFKRLKMRKQKPDPAYRLKLWLQKF